MAKIRGLGAAFDALEREAANRMAVDIARLWALAECGRSEIEGLRWSTVDLAMGLLTLAETKNGKSVRPICRMRASGKHDAASKFRTPVSGRERRWPLSGRQATMAQGSGTSGLVRITPHSLRHTMGSNAVSTGEAVAMTGAILGHANMRSTAIYGHVQRDPAKRAADRVSRRIAAALEGRQFPLPEKLLAPLRRFVAAALPRSP